MNSADEQQIIKEMAFPARPFIVQMLHDAQKQSVPDIKLMVNAIESSPGIAVAVLEAINSPFYHLKREVDSISLAISYLGTQNIINLVIALSLRGALLGRLEVCDDLEGCWDKVSKVAMVSALLSKRLDVGKQDEAYLVGLFHESGMPFIYKRFSDYFDCIDSVSHSDGASVTNAESSRYGINHATISYYFCREWGVSAELCEVIRHHHDLDLLLSNDGNKELKERMSLLLLAEQMVRIADKVGVCREWDEIRPRIYYYLGLEEQRRKELSQEVKELLAEYGKS